MTDTKKTNPKEKPSAEKAISVDKISSQEMPGHETIKTPQTAAETEKEKGSEFLEVDGYGRFEVYANRDSLKYQSAYGLDDSKTLYRGTMRRVGFSRVFQALAPYKGKCLRTVGNGGKLR